MGRWICIRLFCKWGRGLVRVMRMLRLLLRIVGLSQVRCVHPMLNMTIDGSIGSTFAGYVSQYIGRRLTIIVLVLWTGAFIPLWIIPGSFSALSAGAFFIQFGVQGAWGVIPIQLAEVSPPAFRATFPGVAYQLGNVRRSTCNAVMFVN